MNRIADAFQADAEATPDDESFAEWMVRQGLERDEALDALAMTALTCRFSAGHYARDMHFFMAGLIAGRATAQELA